jgi:hypothetical protein
MKKEELRERIREEREKERIREALRARQFSNIETFEQGLSLIDFAMLFGSEQDIKDAEGIYVRQFDNLDMGYLTERCRKLDVLEDFSAMKRRAERYMVEKGG